MSLWFNKKDNKVTRTEDKFDFMPMNHGMGCSYFSLELDNIKISVDIIIDNRGLRHEIHCKKLFLRDWDTDFFSQ